jgi:hypothetical protein
MRKIVLSEEQTNKLMKSVIGEQVPAMRETNHILDDGRYRMKCEFNFNYDHIEFITYKGGEIDNIDNGYGEISFMLNIVDESYGIREIQVTDIRGPKEIQTEIRYYPEGTSSDDEDWWEKRIEEKLIIPLDWKKLKIDDDGYEMNYIGVGKRIDVEVYPDERGGLIGKSLEATIKNLIPADE